MNHYRDTQERYDNDPEFRAAVTSLEQAAERNGFTPGELKQIAFKAALNLEMRARPLMYVSRGSGSTLLELVPEEQRGHFVAVPVEADEVAGYLKDGTPIFFGKAPA